MTTNIPIIEKEKELVRELCQNNQFYENVTTILPEQKVDVVPLLSKQNKDKPITPAEFQTAIAATKFGLFNIILLVICIPAAWAIQFESTLSSYIIPAAACDLGLDATQKGLLNSMPFFGMVTSGFIWGFLLDTMGRKKILLMGFFAHFLIVLGKSLSPNVPLLSTLMFFGGSISGGMYVAMTTYATEFHSTEYRGRIQMIYGMMFACGNIIIPLTSSVVLPLKFTIRLLFIDFHAWNLLILISSINPLLSMIVFYYLPETPKFLMSIGKNQDALEVLRKMYKMNTRDVKENYPIESLIEEIGDKEDSAANKKSWREYLKLGWQQISPIFGKQYGMKLLLVCTVQGIILMGINTLRLYMPQIFQATHEYQVAHNGTSSNLCDILHVLRSPSGSDEVICTVNLENNFRVYLNSVVIASVTLTGYVMAGFLINLFGKKLLLGMLGVSASIAGSCLYFSPDPTTTLALSSLYLAASGICFDIFITVIVVVFPTTLRAMAISICLLAGRSLTVLGNSILPILVEIGCAPPFIFVGILLLVAVLLSCVTPNTGKEDMH